MAPDCGDFAESFNAGAPVAPARKEPKRRALYICGNKTGGRGPPAPMPTPSGRSTHQDVGKLPRVADIDVLRKQFAATLKRRPVGVTPDHRAKIRPLQIQAAAEV